MRRGSWRVGLMVLVAAVALVAQEPQGTGTQQGTTATGQQQGQGRGRGRGGTPDQPMVNGECPPGTTEWRAGRCRAPEFPPPSIVDYRPRTTLVTEQHQVPKARFPAIDFHGHPGNRLGSAESLAALTGELDAMNVRMMVVAENQSGAGLQRTLQTVNGSPHKDRFRVFTGINFSNVGPGWAEKAVAQLEADVKAGAVGVGEVSKAFGLRTRKADGSLLKIDDPDLSPVWEACARLNLPVFIHTGEPQEFFEPIDYHNERWLELALFSDRRYPPETFPRFEELMAQRDRLFKAHPRTRFVAAHLGWHGNDLARLGRMLDDMPNVTTELGAVLYDLGRQPRTAHDFLVKYQDRVMFGKDTYEPSEYPYYFRVFETRDEYFDYYRDYHAFWKLYGLALPDEVLKKIYYKNALRVTPGLPQSGWPR